MWRPVLVDEGQLHLRGVGARGGLHGEHPVAVLLEVALQRHVEKQNEDHAVICPPDPNIEFHLHAGLRGKDQHAVLIAALHHIEDILARNHVEQRLADQPLTKETDGSAVRRHDGARAVNREEAVIKHAANLCQHFRLGYGMKVFRGGHLRLAVVTGDHNSSRSPFKNSSSGSG